MPVASKEFVDCLRKSNLLTDEQFAECRNALDSDGASPDRVAKRLVAKGIITRWQAKQLLDGRYTFFLGRYKLLERLGQGKYGVVFKAQQAEFDRYVALKIMSNAALAHPRAAARFQREIRVAAALNHPNIVAAFDAECVGETHFLVMEYVEGRDLKTWINEFGRLPIDWSCECIIQAATGLQYAHTQGLVHRDIKPGNLIVSAADTNSKPTVKLLDMGLARMVVTEGQDDPDRITKTGHVLGTIDFIAPEQIESTKSVDVRADIYGLGCTLFKALTGQVPFNAKSMPEKVIARLKGDAPRVQTLRGDVPPELDDIIAKMLARDPAQRFQTPQEVVEALLPFGMSTVVEEEEQIEEEPSEAEIPRPPSGTLSGPPPAASDGAEERIVMLEMQIAELERRVAELEIALRVSSLR